MTEQQGIEIIVSAAAEVHREMGPGLLEQVYEECLCRELALRGVHVERQVPFRLSYKGRKLEREAHMPLLVEGTVAVRVRSVENLLSLHEAQLLTGMKLGGWKRGFLFNFNVTRFEDGVRRLSLSE